MQRFTLAVATVLIALAARTPAQTSHPAAPGTPNTPAFTVVDIHNSYHRYGGYFNGSDLAGEKYILQQARMLDLIETAYDVDEDHVLGGPLWIESDRFDLNARAPAGSSKQALAQMLQTMLADRFKLVVHPDTRVMPAYLLTVLKGSSKLKQANQTSADQSGCGLRSTETGPPQTATGAPTQEFILSCNNVTMQKFAETLQDIFGQLLRGQVVDSTGLKGSWTFEMHIPWNQMDSTSVLDVVKNQLGLKLEPARTPQRVIVVDTVVRKPTPNPPEVARLLPPENLQFEVAVINPAPPRKGQAKRTHVEFNGHEADFRNTTMQFLIMQSYDVNEATLVDIPPWFLSSHWDITAKAPVDPTSKNPELALDDEKAMLRSLLVDRFKLKMHTETRPADGWVMLAAGPKLKKAADTDIRPTCSVGPVPGGKDPRILNPILTGLITCRNVTMPEFADRLSTMLSDDFKTPVVDATEITGRYDLQLSYTKDRDMHLANALPKTAAPADGTSGVSDPSGAISLLDAFSHQLGLKFVQQKRPMQVLVVDHVEETPTEN